MAATALREGHNREQKAWGWGWSAERSSGAKLPPKHRPVPLHWSGLKVVQVAVGLGHMVLLTDTGTVHVVGNGKYGRLGLGHGADTYILSQNHFFTKIRVTHVCCGHYHTAVISSTGEVYTWGRGSNGQLGHGDTQDQLFPAKVEGLSGIRATSCALGAAHTLVVGDRGELFAFGLNDVGQLGLGPPSASSFASTFAAAAAIRKAAVVTVPQQLSSKHFVRKRVVAVACGFVHSGAIAVGLDGNGEVFMWGFNGNNELGIRSDNKDGKDKKEKKQKKKQKQTKSGGGKDGVKVKEKEKQKEKEDEDEEDKREGKNEEEEGSSSNDGAQMEVDCVWKPTKPVAALLGKNVVDLACGRTHTVAVTDVGEVYTWGSSTYGQLGYGSGAEMLMIAESKEERQKPQRVKGLLFKKRVISVKCGEYHTLALTNQGQLYSWGLNDYGQLGLGKSTTTAAAPARTGSKDHFVTKIAASGRHSLCATSFKPIISVRESTLGQDLQKYFNNAELSDVVFEFAEDRLLYAHRVIVGRTKALRDLMKQNKAKAKKSKKSKSKGKEKEKEKEDDENGESSNNKTRIRVEERIPYHVFEQIVKYLYVDDIKLRDENVGEILILAEEFGLVDLQARCHVFEQAPSIVYPPTLGKGLRQHLFNPKFSDISFVFDENNSSSNDDKHEDDDEEKEKEDKKEATSRRTVIHAHKVIMAGRCPAFHAMLLGNFVESSQNEIHLSDMSALCFKKLLQYIYLDSIEWNFASDLESQTKQEDQEGDKAVEEEKEDPEADALMELLVVANEYRLERLRDMCESEIERGVDVENVSWVYELADRHDAQQLREFCRYFILHRFEEVQQTQTFISLREDLKQDIDRIRGGGAPSGSSSSSSNSNNKDKCLLC